MKFCYIDESGLGPESYLVMVGVIADAQRMHRTKEIWEDFLGMLSKICKRRVNEFHTRDFYAGNGAWRGIDGPERARIISAILDWWGRRKHHLIFTAINKQAYTEARSDNKLLDGCVSLWQTAAIHIALTIQKAHQKISNKKGHTLLLFDREVKEEKQFSAFISNPPDWTDEYYCRNKKQNQLDQIIDIPFFGDSQQVLLLQVADVIAFILRRYAEIIDAGSKLRYDDELKRIKGWIKLINNRAYPVSTRWPSKGGNEVHRLFCDLAPNSIRDLKGK